MSADGLTLAHLCNRFLTAKLHKLDSGEMGRISFGEYKEATDLLVAQFGGGRLVEDLAGDDFQNLRATIAKRWGPVRLGNAITRIKSVFKFGIDNGLTTKAIRYGSEFGKPGKAVLRRHRAASVPRSLGASLLRELLDAADMQTQAAILLGLNCGYGNHDVAARPLGAVDLDAGFVNFPRPKTGIPRRCPLWPETVDALRAVIAERPKPTAEAAALVFVNERGGALVRITEKSRTDCLGVRFANLLKSKKVHKEGVGFYTLRHVFRTVADGARDPVAIDLIMGHADNTMGANYRGHVDDGRLRAVVDVVRAWLWPKEKAGKEPATFPFIGQAG